MRSLFGDLGRFISEYYRRLRGFSRNIRLFILFGVLTGIGLTFWGLLFTLYLQAAGYYKKSIGDVLMVGNIAVSLFTLPAGYLIGKYNPTKILVAASICSALLLIAALNTLDKPSLLSIIFL